jgi:gas vesicle protein
MLTGLVILAAAVGAVAALFVTPRSGKEMREGVKRKSMDLKDRLPSSKHEMNDAADNVQDKIAESKDKADESSKDAKSKMKQVAKKPDANDAIDRIRRNGEP